MPDETLIRDDAQKLAFFAQLLQIYETEGADSLTQRLVEAGIPRDQIEKVVQTVQRMAQRPS